MGRKRQYNSDADRQYAYRERMKKAAEDAWVDETFLEIDILQFFTRVTKLVPTEKQKELLLALGNLDDKTLRKILISAGRQTGKSLCCAVAAVYLTIKNKLPVLIASAKENYIYGHIVKIFADNPELHHFVLTQGVNEVVPKDGYKLKNGSELILLTSTEKGLRGASGRIMFLDEPELMDEQTIITALGNLSGDTKLILLGTPSSKYSKFNEILKNPQKYGFTLFTWSELDCGWQKDLEDKKKLMSEDQWRREVLGLLSEPDIKLLWDAEIIDRCIQNQVLTEGGIRYAGIDAGGTGREDRDRFALVIVEKMGKYKFKVLYYKTWNFETLGKVREEVPMLLKLYNVRQVRMDSLPMFWTDIITELYGKDKVFPVTFKAYKEEMMGQLTHVIQSQGLSVSVECEDLIQQMKSFKKQGRPHYDDLVDGLMLATYQNDVLFPEKKPSGGCCVMVDYSKGTVWQNYGKNSGKEVAFSNLSSQRFYNVGRNQRKGLCSR
jgi:hypothetical protein